MKLILVRHGETDANRDFIVLGQVDEKLNGAGTQQAKDMAMKLKGTRIDAAYTSPLIRASATATEIMRFHEGIRLQLADELKERYCGEVEGRRGASAEDCAAIGFGPNENGETLGQLQKRVFDFVKRISAEHGNDTVLFVCHAGVILALLTALEKRPASDIPKMTLPKNGEFMVIDIGNLNAA